MLVVQVPKGESVRIGSSNVKVHRIRGNAVRLAIDAPPDVPIVRSNAKVKNAKGQKRWS